MTVTTMRERPLVHAAHRDGSLSPRERDLLWEMEELFWTGDGGSARATMASNSVMIFASPPGILQGDQIWTHLRHRTGWRSVVMAERRVSRCGDLAILTCRVSAEKPDAPVFKALTASTYLHDDGSWLRHSHQQTLVP